MVDMTEKARLRAEYNIAEYALISARALRRMANEHCMLSEYSDESLAHARKYGEAERAAEQKVDDARIAAEAAGVIVNAHTALQWL